MRRLLSFQMFKQPIVYCCPNVMFVICVVMMILRKSDNIARLGVLFSRISFQMHLAKGAYAEKMWYVDSCNVIVQSMHIVPHGQFLLLRLSFIREVYSEP
jgi:hypothetical protein